MVALHGREDALLDAGGSPGCSGRRTTPRWPTCARSATTSTRSRRTGPRSRAQPPAAPRERAPRPAARHRGGAGAVAGEPADRRHRTRQRPATRRSGSGAARARRSEAGEIPLIGVVQIERPPSPWAWRSPRRSAPWQRRPRRRSRRAPGRPGRRRRPPRPPAEVRGRRRRRGPAAPKPRAAATPGQEEGGVSATRRAATLPVSFFERPAEVVARELLGATVVSTLDGGRTAGRIVEAEAYLGYDDPASHGYRHRRHAQNEALFGPPGTWYVYLSYGMHWCANLVCGAAGRGQRGAAARTRAGRRAWRHAASVEVAWPTASSARGRASSARRWPSRGTRMASPMRRLGRRGAGTRGDPAAGRDRRPRASASPRRRSGRSGSWSTARPGSRGRRGPGTEREGPSGRESEAGGGSNDPPPASSRGSGRRACGAQYPPARTSSRALPRPMRRPPVKVCVGPVEQPAEPRRCRSRRWRSRCRTRPLVI